MLAKGRYISLGGIEREVEGKTGTGLAGIAHSFGLRCKSFLGLESVRAAVDLISMAIAVRNDRDEAVNFHLHLSSVQPNCTQDTAKAMKAPQK